MNVQELAIESEVQVADVASAPRVAPVETLGDIELALVGGGGGVVSLD